MTHPNRRTFLGAAGMLAVSGGLVRAASANDRVRMAVIGLRSRGAAVAMNFAKQPGAEVVAVCDIDDSMFAKPVKAIENHLAASYKRVLESYATAADGQLVLPG